MVENILRYNYDVKVCEKYYMTKEEALAVIREEMKAAQKKNHAVILTGKLKEDVSFFDAFTAEKISHNFTWIHSCPQEILKFDDKQPQEGNHYVMIFEGLVKRFLK